MGNLYTYRVMPEEMAGLIALFKLIGGDANRARTNARCVQPR